MEQCELHVDVQSEDGSLWSEVRELPGCFASGDTVAELIESVVEAIALYPAAPEGEPASIAIALAGFDLSLGSGKPPQAA